jgi:hypothetical protein
MLLIIKTALSERATNAGRWYCVWTCLVASLGELCTDFHRDSPPTNRTRASAVLAQIVSGYPFILPTIDLTLSADIPS